MVCRPTGVTCPFTASRCDRLILDVCEPREHEHRRSPRDRRQPDGGSWRRATRPRSSDRDSARPRRVSHEVLTADTREESARLAEEAAARGADALLVVGGDGTVQTVLRTVHSHQLPLGILPAGTGNDAARML
ncbi:acylglycerol kinase family protein, partial [Klebsiella quasipneumoniae]|nr:acylglycerol kinase family protein [Klebsiella quasipneumoniae]